ncbi:MAG TPA: hypothetical protein VN961_11195 [Streptosporangiaceae bacterium]|nr:hypothetical protein [Streptosporangiaceae bacterium]
MSQVENDGQPSGQDQGPPAGAMQELGRRQVADAKRARDLAQGKILDGGPPECQSLANAHLLQYRLEQLTVLNRFERITRRPRRGGQRSQG